MCPDALIFPAQYRHIAISVREKGLPGLTPSGPRTYQRDLSQVVAGDRNCVRCSPDGSKRM